MVTDKNHITIGIIPHGKPTFTSKVIRGFDDPIFDPRGIFLAQDFGFDQHFYEIAFHAIGCHIL